MTNVSKMVNKSEETAAETVTASKPKAKEKRRNNEKRKEKSRDAARCRRSRETEIFTDLASILPLRSEEVEQLDKASVMRLSIAYLKIRDMLELFPEKPDEKLTSSEKSIENGEDFENLVMQAVDGFLLVLSADGDIIFVSENVSDILGIQQIDVIGQQIWDYSHQCDHDELRDILNGRRDSTKENDGVINAHHTIFLRLKCTLTSRGRSVNIKSASYKVIQLTGHTAVKNDKRQLIVIGRPVPHPSNIEIPLGINTFLTKHSLDMKFTYVDEKMSSVLGYESDDLMGKSLFEFQHGEDSASLMKSFKSVLSKGQTETLRYRYLAKCGGYSWIVTQATLVYDKQKPQSVVCVNYVISGIENENDIYTCAQLEARQKSKKPIELNNELNTSDKDIIETKRDKPSNNRSCAPAVNNLKAVTSKLLPTIKDNKPRSVTASVFSSVADIIPSKLPIQTRAQSVTASVFTPLPTSNARPQSNTAKLFAPRTEDMNRSLLMFLDEGNDSTANMLKEEQDDLANLAPTAGDECIPLDVSTPLFGEMFDGFILPDGYGTLLPDDIGQFDAQNSKANVDPFMNYRDDSNDTIGTPNVLSPRDSSKSPNSSSLPSLCSPNSLSHDDEFAFMTMNCEDDIDLTMRAPYIPMNENDDLPLLTEDLMWSAFSDELSLHKDIREALQNEHFKDSSLAAALLSANNNLSQINQNEMDLKKNKTTDQNDDGGNGMITSEEIMKQVYNKSSNQEHWSMNDLIQISPPPIAKTISNISPIQNNTNRVLKPPPRTYNKRPLHQSPLELNGTKRVKPTFDQQQSAPQLLQQLMAPTSQQRVRLKEDAPIKMEPTTKWTMEKNSQMQLIEQQQQQTSNSVLKNLLDDVSMKPPDILLQCHSPQALTSTMADIDQDIDPFQTANNSNLNSIVITNYDDRFSDRINNDIRRSNHDKLLGHAQNNQYMANRKDRKMAFSSLDGDPSSIMTIETLLQDLGDTAMESPTRLLFDENILNDDEISRNLSNWAMT